MGLRDVTHPFFHPSLFSSLHLSQRAQVGGSSACQPQPILLADWSGASRWAVLAEPHGCAPGVRAPLSVLHPPVEKQLCQQRPDPGPEPSPPVSQLMV